MKGTRETVNFHGHVLFGPPFLSILFARVGGEKNKKKVATYPGEENGEKRRTKPRPFSRLFKSEQDPKPNAQVIGPLNLRNPAINACSRMELD